MKRLTPVLEKERTRLYVRLIANGLLQAIAIVAILFLVRYIFDNLAVRHGPVQVGKIFRISLVLAGVGIIQGLLTRLARVDSARLGRGYTYDLRMDLFDHLVTLSPRSIERRSEGAIMLRFTGDISAIRRWITRGMARGMVAVLTMLIALGVLAWLSWQLALASMIFLLLGLFASYSPGNSIRQAVNQLRRVRAHLMASIGEQISALATIQVFGREKRERKRFARRNQAVLDAGIRQAKAAGALQAITRSMATIARALILAVGAAEVARGSTTIGTVAAAMTVAGLLSSRIRRLGRVYTYYQKARIARHKITQFLAIPSLLITTEIVPDLQVKTGRLEFKRVSFADAVKDVSITAEPGELIALVGPNGAGKSTLLSLACRLIDPEHGQVFLDGQDLARHSLDSIRQAISMVSSELPLMRGSVRRNLRYRYPKSTPEQLEEISRLCGLDDLLHKLPEGDRTRVMEGGKNFSLGERQKISLARAILGNPAILLLDEADTNLDSEAARVLDRVLQQFKGTIIMVTHLRERIAHADTIWHMEKGRIMRVEKPLKPEKSYEEIHD